MSLCWLVGDELHEFAELPSGGDCSYPSFVELEPGQLITELDLAGTLLFAPECCVRLSHIKRMDVFDRLLMISGLYCQ